MALSVAVTVFGFGVPFRGSLPALFAISSAYLGGHAGAGTVDLDAGEEPVCSQPGGADHGFSAGLSAVGLHLRNRQHAGPIRLLTALPAAAILRVQLADAVSGRRRGQRAGAERAGAGGMAAVLFFALARVTRVRLE